MLRSNCDVSKERQTKDFRSARSTPAAGRRARALCPLRSAARTRPPRSHTGCAPVGTPARSPATADAARARLLLPARALTTACSPLVCVAQVRWALLTAAASRALMSCWTWGPTCRRSTGTLTRTSARQQRPRWTPSEAVGRTGRRLYRSRRRGLCGCCSALASARAAVSPFSARSRSCAPDRWAGRQDQAAALWRRECPCTSRCYLNGTFAAAQTEYRAPAARRVGRYADAPSTAAPAASSVELALPRAVWDENNTNVWLWNVSMNTGYTVTVQWAYFS